VKVFVGEDPKEKAAAKLAIASLQRRARSPVSVTSLHLERLAAAGLLRRPVDARGGMYDLRSQAPQSTEFAISRFLVPILAQHGWALFVDCDVVFLEDVWQLLAIADPKYAVLCVQHQHQPQAETKMVDQVQTRYRARTGRASASGTATTRRTAG
jgi:hypothetical protein